MTENYLSPSIRCPFYIGLFEKTSIECEGFDESLPRMKTVIRMYTGREIKEYAGRYCCAAYEQCPVYRMIEREKYGGE